MTHHHLDQSTLVEYAAGSLPEPVAMLTATHLALCPECRATSAMLDSAGAAMMNVALDDDTAFAGPDTALRDKVFAALDDDVDPAAKAAPAAAAKPDLVIPRPLRDYLGCGVDDLEFRSIGGGLEAIDILPDYPGFTTRLMRIEASRAMPLHTHEGTEMTLVLDGGFNDGTDVYHRGDVAIADPSVEHKPVAEDGVDCICLAVNSADVRLTGPIGRLLNPFVSF